MSKSPTSRTLEWCRKQDIFIDVVERRIGPPGSYGVTKDLFGFIDLIALEDLGVGVIGIQACATGDISKRFKKSTTGERGTILHRWLNNMNSFEIWGWAKRGKLKRWTLKKMAVVLDPDTGIFVKIEIP